MKPKSDPIDLFSTAASEATLLQISHLGRAVLRTRSVFSKLQAPGPASVVKWHEETLKIVRDSSIFFDFWVRNFCFDFLVVKLVYFESRRNRFLLFTTDPGSEPGSLCQNSLDHRPNYKDLTFRGYNQLTHMST